MVSLMDLPMSWWTDTLHLRADGTRFVTVSAPGPVIDILDNLAFACDPQLLMVNGEELRLQVANADMTFVFLGHIPERHVNRYAFVRGSWEPEDVAIAREEGCTWCERFNHLELRHLSHLAYDEG